MKYIIDTDALTISPAAVPPVEPVQPAAVIPEVASGRKLAWGSKVSQTFRDRVWWIADTLKMDGNFIMAAMAWESGESFSASKKNMAGSGATGLIQFMPTTAKGLGTTTDALAKMSAEDQLNYVYRYFLDAIKVHGPLTTLEDVYMSILWPAAIGQSASYVLWDSKSKPTTFRQNAGLDTNKDGQITKYEAASHVREKLVKGLPLAA